MDPSRKVSEVNGDISRKSQKFPTPVYLTTPLKRIPLKSGVGDWDKKN